MKCLPQLYISITANSMAPWSFFTWISFNWGGLGGRGWGSNCKTNAPSANHLRSSWGDPVRLMSPKNPKTNSLGSHPCTVTYRLSWMSRYGCLSETEFHNSEKQTWWGGVHDEEILEAWGRGDNHFRRFNHSIQLVSRLILWRVNDLHLLTFIQLAPAACLKIEWDLGGYMFTFQVQFWTFETLYKYRS